MFTESELDEFEKAVSKKAYVAGYKKGHEEGYDAGYEKGAKDATEQMEYEGY